MCSNIVEKIIVAQKPMLNQNYYFSTGRCTEFKQMETLSLNTRLRNAGIMISDLDLLIGCTAVEYDLIMVTENISEFERILGTELENRVDRNK